MVFIFNFYLFLILILIFKTAIFGHMFQKWAYSFFRCMVISYWSTFGLHLVRSLKAMQIDFFLRIRTMEVGPEKRPLHGPRCTSPRIFNVEPCQQCIIDRLSHKSFIDKWFSEHHSRATLQRCWVHGMSGKKPSNHVSTLITFTIYSTRNVFFSPPHACVGYGSRITRLGFLCPPKYFVCMYFVRLYEESL